MYRLFFLLLFIFSIDVIVSEEATTESPLYASLDVFDIPLLSTSFFFKFDDVAAFIPLYTCRKMIDEQNAAS